MTLNDGWYEDLKARDAERREKARAEEMVKIAAERAAEEKRAAEFAAKLQRLSEGIRAERAAEQAAEVKKAALDAAKKKMHEQGRTDAEIGVALRELNRELKNTFEPWD